MTKGQIQERASAALEDAGLVHFTRTNLNESFQDGYELVVLLTQSIEKVAQITIPIGSQVIDMTTLLPDYYRPLAFYSQNNTRWLFPKTYKKVQDNAVFWSNSTGNVREWAPLGEKHILFFPSPTVAQTLQIFYSATPPELTDTQSPEFYADCHKMLEFYICSDMLEQDLRYTESTKYFQMFMVEIEEVRLRLNRRSFLANLLELQCRSTVTPISNL